MSVDGWILSPEQRLHVFASPCGQWRTDLSGVIVEVNEQTAALKGCTPDDLLGMSSDQLVAPDVPRATAPDGRMSLESWESAGHQQRLLDGEVVYQEMRTTRPDGHVEWSAVTVRAVFTDGDLSGYDVGFCAIDHVLEAMPRTHPVSGLQDAFAAAFGKRLRSRAQANLAASVDALRAGDGGTIVLRVPPSRSEPVEIAFWSYEGTVRFTESL